MDITKYTKLHQWCYQQVYLFGNWTELHKDEAMYISLIDFQ